MIPLTVLSTFLSVFRPEFLGSCFSSCCLVVAFGFHFSVFFVEALLPLSPRTQFFVLILTSLILKGSSGFNSPC